MHKRFSFSAVWVVLGTLALLTTSGLLGSRAQAQRTPVSVTSDRLYVHGEVLVRTEYELTILGALSELHTVQVSRDTAIVRGAETISLAEIRVGDKVSVTLRRGADGSLQAVNVAVRTGFEPES